MPTARSGIAAAVLNGEVLVFGGETPEDTLYIVGPVTWLGALQPFLVAAGIGTPAFLIWVLWQWLRARRAARPEAGAP